MAVLPILLVSCVGVFLAVKLKPSHESFGKYYRQAYLGEDSSGSSRATKKKKGFLGGMLECLLPGRSAKALPPTVLHDCIIFYLAVVKLEKDQFAYFLGGFGVWVPLMAPEQIQDKSQGVSEAEAFAEIERVKHIAIQYKASGQYEEAGKKYEELGSEASSTDALEAADAFEHAAKCYKMIKDYKAFVRCSERAISIFNRQNRYVKCALLYESLVDPTMTPVTDQIRFLQEASQFYDLADDKRSSPIKEKLANLYGAQGFFQEAAQFYITRSNDLASDPILIHAARKNFLFGRCCMVLHEQNGQVALSQSGFPGWFIGSREALMLQTWINWYEGEVEEFNPTISFPTWLISATSHNNKSLC